MRKILTAAVLASAIGIVAAAPASAAEILITTTSVPGAVPAGAVVYTGAVDGADTLPFSIGGEVFLQRNSGVYEYGTNAAGVLTTGSTNTYYANTPGGFEVYSTGGDTYTYGSLLATLTTGSFTRTVQVFPTNAGTGAGSPKPPSAFTYNGTLASLFGAFAPSASGTLTFSVADTGFDDNAGAFSVAAVPETATWIAMILGFGAIGATLRTRRSQAALRVA